MKKFLTVFACLLMVAAINAQTLEEIVKRSSDAYGYNKISDISTIKITGKTMAMGMEIPIEMWMKSPDKFKSVTNFNGQEMITAFDGTKGYMINPMTGSTTPVEMSAEEAKQTQSNNYFKNNILAQMKEGKLSLMGEENVNNKPAFKIKQDIGQLGTSIMYIDKESYLTSKVSTTVNQGGMEIVVDMFPSDYKSVNGIMFPMKTKQSMQGMEAEVVFDKVEVNIPMDDSIFKLK